METEIQMVHQNDIDRLFREIPEPPKKIFIRGKLPPLGTKYLTVVGSRHHTNYGGDACKKLIKGLTGYPITIVSGLALGIDTIAHTTAMEIGLNTIAFPGSGLGENSIYPASNKMLAKKIVESGGALISEFEENTKAAQWTFPRRNRLMAGIADAILIIEAEEKSGTLITARLALDYNRELLIVPGSIFSPASMGTNKLLRDGGHPILSSKDILSALGWNNMENHIEKELESLSMNERKILEILRDPCDRDEIIREMEMGIVEINAILSAMEIKGLIKEEYGEIRRT
jgi:DNA processing protein